MQRDSTSQPALTLRPPFFRTIESMPYPLQIYIYIYMYIHKRDSQPSSMSDDEDKAIKRGDLRHLMQVQMGAGEMSKREESPNTGPRPRRFRKSHNTAIQRMCGYWESLSSSAWTACQYKTKERMCWHGETRSKILGDFTGSPSKNGLS